MKPGDKVWIFDDDQIKQVDLIDLWGKGLLVDNSDKDNPYGIPKSWTLSKPHFPTREALCEHYRKIFDEEITLPRKAKVINEERLLFGEVVDIFWSRLYYIDIDNEHYEKQDLLFL